MPSPGLPHLLVKEVEGEAAFDIVIRFNQLEKKARGRGRAS